MYTWIIVFTIQCLGPINAKYTSAKPSWYICFFLPIPRLIFSELALFLSSDQTVQVLEFFSQNHFLSKTVFFLSVTSDCIIPTVHHDECINKNMNSIKEFDGF